MIPLLMALCLTAVPCDCFEWAPDPTVVEYQVMRCWDIPWRQVTLCREAGRTTETLWRFDDLTRPYPPFRQTYRVAGVEADGSLRALSTGSVIYRPQSGTCEVCP